MAEDDRGNYVRRAFVAVIYMNVGAAYAADGYLDENLAFGKRPVRKRTYLKFFVS